MGRRDKEITVERYTSHDRGDWLRLRRNLWGDVGLSAHERRMDEILGDVPISSAVYIGRIDGAVAGFIEVTIHQTAPGCRTGGIGYIEAWYVEPLFRRTGLGRALVRSAEKWAMSKGCAEMATETEERYPFSPVAAKSLGYTETEVPRHFMKSIRLI